MDNTPKTDRSKDDHEYERLNPGAERPNPHRPESSYGMNTGKAGGTYGDAAGEYSETKEKVTNEKDDASASTPGGQPQEKVSDRPNVSTVEPEDYPAEDRKNMTPVKRKSR